MDVDANAKIAELFAAQSVPSVVAVLGGQPVPLFQGQASAQQLEQIFEQVMQMAQANRHNRSSTPRCGAGGAK